MEPHFGVDRITGDLYAMDATSMTLISDMSQVSTSLDITSQ